MAELAVSIVKEKLVPLLIQEAKLLERLHGEVAGIKDEMEFIGEFLRDADDKLDINRTAKVWVKQIREVAYRMEDVVDEFYHLAEKRARRGIIGSIKRTMHFIVKWKQHRDIANEIEGIKQTLGAIRKRSKGYGVSFNSSGEGSSSSLRRVARNLTRGPGLESLLTKEAEVVGFDEHKSQLIRWLVEEEPRRSAISLVGMGGLGKSTLAKEVFDNHEVKRYSQCRAWIPVSQSYKVEEILRSMIKQFHQATKEKRALGDISQTNAKELTRKLGEYLQQKRYLVVFDDVWATEFWGSIKQALPDNGKGSRIIVTTRLSDVASSFQESESSSDRVFKLQPLPPEEAWELFCNKVFGSSVCPEEFMELSRDTVQKCFGLPLALLVSSNSLRSKFENNDIFTNITPILYHSYHDLPFYLKSCYLYFAIFPEDYPIGCTEMMRLWIAEGFVKEAKGKTLEDVAKEYLDELIKRSLVQKSSEDIDGQPQKCQVHDLMRDILLSKYEESSFCRVFPEKDFNFDGSIRRLSIHNYDEDIPESADFSKVRSFFLSGVNDLPKKITDALFKAYRVLKVLDFEGSNLTEIPEDIGVLYQLRYLNVRKTKVSMLPKSIGKLHNLETLNIKGSGVTELPIEIRGLGKLRHLLAYYLEHEADKDSLQGVKMPKKVGSLEALQNLSYVEANHDDGLFRKLGELRQLRKLGITKLQRGDWRDLCAAVNKMEQLLTWNVSSINKEELLDVQSIPSPSILLQQLYLKARLEKLPDWISQLHNLVRLRLTWSRLSGNPLNLLQHLPKLLDLGLCEAYDGEQLHFEASGFQKLKLLELDQLNKLSVVKIDKGALPLLKELTIGHCPLLREVPQGIRNLTKVNTLLFIDMPTEFMRRIQLIGGPDYLKVNHIPTVLLRGTFDGSSYQTVNLYEEDCFHDGSSHQTINRYEKDH